MEHMDVSRVVEVRSADAADKHLAIGWKILTVYTTTYDTVGPLIANQTPHFVLGWPDEGGEPQFPSAEDRWYLDSTEL